MFEGLQGALLCLPHRLEGSFAAVWLRLLHSDLVARRLQLWREERHHETPCWWLPAAATIIPSRKDSSVGVKVMMMMMMMDG